MKNLIFKLGVSTLTFLFGSATVWFLFAERKYEAVKVSLPVISQPEIEPITEPIIKKTDYGVLPQNPYDLKKIINDKPDYFPVYKLWGQLGIESEMRTLNNPFFYGNEKKQSVYFEDCVSCNAEIFELNLDNDLEKEVLLGVGDYGGFDKYRFLAFKKSKNAWKFIGYADHDFNKYYSPKVRVKIFNSEKFLVLTCLGGSGTGISISFERWFEIENNQLKEVLSFPNESISAMTTSDLQRESKVTVKNLFIKKGKKYFEVEFINNFVGHLENCNDDYESETLEGTSIFKSKKIGYYFQNKKGIYQLDEKLSQITNEEIVKAYIPDGLNATEFKRLYPNEVKNVLRERKSCREKWLKWWFSLD
jgi:hypothetical protein